MTDHAGLNTRRRCVWCQGKTFRISDVDGQPRHGVCEPDATRPAIWKGAARPGRNSMSPDRQTKNREAAGG